MGYTHDTAMSQFMSPFNYGYTAGTWTPTITSDVISNVRSAAAASTTILVPVEVPSNSAYRKGSLINSIEIFYAIATADLTDFATVTAELMTLGADGTAITGSNSSVAITLDSNHNTAALRKVQGAAHKMTITLNTPIWLSNTQALYIQMILSCATTSVVTMYGANINFTARS